MVSIIIVSYNTKELLQSCLESLHENIKSIDFEIIVVDNASTDESVEMIRKFKAVHVIKNKENVGFAKANNIAVKESKGEYILFLNSDTRFEKNNLEDMINLLKNDGNGVVGALLKVSTGAIEKSYGKFPGFFSIFRYIIMGERFGSALNEGKKPFEVDWVNGAGMLIRKSLFEKVKGFDENFFMYVEDIEFCYRIKKAGYKIWYDPRVEIFHLGQGSSNRSFAVIQIYKGLLHFYKKHKSFFEYEYVKFLLTVKAIILIAVGEFTGNRYLSDTYRKAIMF